jgi:hypothetical protein
MPAFLSPQLSVLLLGFDNWIEGELAREQWTVATMHRVTAGGGGSTPAGCEVLLPTTRDYHR